MKRREFLRNTTFTTAGSLLVPQFLKAYETQYSAPSTLNEKVVVIIQLSGGNDGLNTVIPVADYSKYFNARPNKVF